MDNLVMKYACTCTSNIHCIHGYPMYVLLVYSTVHIPILWIYIVSMDIQIHIYFMDEWWYIHTTVHLHVHCIDNTTYHIS